MRIAALVFVWLLALVSSAGGSAPEAWLGRPYWTHTFDTPIRQVVELDLDGDGWSEFAVETEDGRLFALDLAGTQRWSVELPADRKATVGPVDLDGDRRSELLAGVSETDRTSSLIAISAMGQELWRRNFELDLTDVYVHGLGASVGMRILVHFRNQVPAPFWVLDATGEIDWTLELSGELNAVTVATLKRGADPAVLLAQGGFGKGDVVLYAMGGTGNLLWTAEPSGAQGQNGQVDSMTVLDLEADGTSEILIITSLGHRRHQLCCFSAAGEEQWCRPAEGASYRDVSIRAAPTPEASRWAIELITGRLRRPYERTTAELAMIRTEAERIASGPAHEERVRYLRRLLEDQIFDPAAARRVFQLRRPTLLRLDLTNLPSESAELPWELLLLADASSGNLLHDVSVLRQLRSSSEEQPLIPIIQPPLRILVVSPDVGEGLPIDAAGEKQRLAEVLDHDLRRQRVEIESLSGKDARVENLGSKLEEGYDIVHFIGHGGLFDDGHPYLVLSDEFGDGHRIEVRRLRELFVRRDRTTRLPFLLFLSSCHSAAGLVRFGSELLGPRRVLAIVGMRGEVEESAATLFAERFYKTLLTSGRLDHAAVRGRQGMVGVLKGETALRTYDWARPVISTCLEDGRLFKWA